jgi:hypothetical protein
MHQKIATECARGVVVYTAGAVCDVAHDEGFDAIAEFGEDIGYCGCEQQQTFGELKGDSFCAERADAMDRFGDFEGVVGGEEGDRSKDVGVFGDGGRDVV